MAKAGGMTCLNCLIVNDPVDMIDVVIDHHAVQNPNVFRVCRRCAIAVIKAAAKSESIGLEEVFPGVAISAGNPGPADSSAAAPEATGALVSGNQPGGEGPGEHRREPELPAGGPSDADSEE